MSYPDPQVPWRRLRHGLVGLGFGIGYFAQEVQPVLSTLDPRVFDARSVGWIVSTFAGSQMIGYLFFGHLADRAKPLTAHRLAAAIFLLGALTSLRTDLPSLLLSRLLFGAACGHLVALLRTAGRLADKQAAPLPSRVIRAMGLGFAAGLFLPTLGRGAANVTVAISIALLVARMPRLGQVSTAPAQHQTIRWSRPVLAICLLPFFSASAIVVFQMMVSSVIVPRVDGSLSTLWLALTLVSLAGTMTGTSLVARRPWPPSRTTSQVLLLLALVLLLPAVPVAGKMMMAVLTVVFFCLNFLDAFLETLFSLLAAQVSPKHTGTVLGYAFTAGSLGRLMVPGLVGEWRERGATMPTVLLMTAALSLVAAWLARLAAPSQK